MSRVSVNWFALKSPPGQDTEPWIMVCSDHRWRGADRKLNKFKMKCAEEV